MSLMAPNSVSPSSQAPGDDAVQCSDVNWTATFVVIFVPHSSVSSEL